MTDPVPSDVREVERQIDASYKANPLLRRPYSVAMWNLLAAGDDRATIPGLRGANPQTQSAMADMLINGIRYPIAWLSELPVSDGPIPNSYASCDYEPAWDLLELGFDYEEVARVFKLASAGAIDLYLDGNEIVARHALLDDVRYEAYNHLSRMGSGSQRQLDLEPIARAIGARLAVQGERFTVRTDEALIRLALDGTRPEVDARFALPVNWEFTRYTLGDARSVIRVIFALAFIRHVARVHAAAAGCLGLGVVDCLVVMRREELRAFACRYAEAEAGAVDAVLRDMRYGSRRLIQPDPALQPIILLTNDVAVIMPQLWLNLSFERNLLVLLNRIPEERAAYSRLVGEKEALMRAELTTALPSRFRTWFGRVPGRPELPDVDLAVIDDKSMCCLLVELKWFLAPADVREVLDRRKEVQRGTKQMERLVAAMRHGVPQLLEVLGIDSRYSIAAVVATREWIGNADAQHPDVPVIRADHLGAKLNRVAYLDEAIRWLKARDYLPVEERHYRVRATKRRIAGYTVRWYGVKPLIHGSYVPI